MDIDDILLNGRPWVNPDDLALKNFAGECINGDINFLPDPNGSDIGFGNFSVNENPAHIRQSDDCRPLRESGHARTDDRPFLNQLLN
jgi:hypothetical protein